MLVFVPGVWKGRKGRKRLMPALISASWVQSEADEFFAHGEAGDAEPAGGFGLVAAGEFDGAAEDFAFGFFEEAGVGVLDFAALGGGEEFVGFFAKGGLGS